MLFATPDFGAAGAVVLVILLAWLLAISLAISSIVLALRSLLLKRANYQRNAAMLLMAGLSFPLFCGLAPALHDHFVYGRKPLDPSLRGYAKEGTPADEVRRILGNPHWIEPGNEGREERWYYWLDSYGIDYFGVVFTSDGRVKNTHGN